MASAKKGSAARTKAPAAAAPAAPATSTAPAAAPPSAAHVTPAPHAGLNITLWTLPAGRVMHRVHLQKYGPGQFNPGNAGNARFSPIVDDKGVVIPTIYAATTFDGAVMETIYRDVPYVPGSKSVDKHRLDDQVHSKIQAGADLVLVDLSAVALRKLGVMKSQLIETEKDQYPGTRKWAEAIHSQHKHVQGLCWVSRQDDSARAVVLFGDRITGALVQTGTSRSLLTDAAAYQEILELALRLDVTLY